MKDVLFLYPLYYSANGLRRFAAYLLEERSQLTFDVCAPCSNPQILDAAQQIADQNGFDCAPRDNYGVGAGALWWLQRHRRHILENYRYIWYFEESCEPVRRGWMRRLVEDLEQGLPVSGWWWHAEGRRRPGAVAHRLKGENGHEVICYENTDRSGVDLDGHPFDGLFDVPGYRGETYVVRTRDFCEFSFPDPRDDFWEARNGIRTYGVKAERFWWRPEDAWRHGYPFPCPNIQWYLLSKYRVFPSPKNTHKSYFRELDIAERKNEAYRPAPIGLRACRARLGGMSAAAVQLGGRVMTRLSRNLATRP